MTPLAIFIRVSPYKAKLTLIVFCFINLTPHAKRFQSCTNIIRGVLETTAYDLKGFMGNNHDFDDRRRNEERNESFCESVQSIFMIRFCFLSPE